MTAPVVDGRPTPGEVWAGRSRQWRVLASGLLVQLGDDNPGAGQPVDEVAAADGPLCPPPARLRLAAHLRREACQEMCVPSCPCRDESEQRVDGLLERADSLAAVVV